MESKFNNIVDFIRDIYKEPLDKIPLHAPIFNGNEKKYLEECIDTTFVSSVGIFVDQFEREIALFTGSKYAVSCVNGTNALYIALLLAGVNPGSEVITQPLTFVATANAITYCGAHPVFLDVDNENLGLSPTALAKWLEKNVKMESRLSPEGSDNSRKPVNRFTGRTITGCLPMHTYGHPCLIDKIVEICTEYNIPVIEDAAESFGSFYKKKHTGTFGTIGVISFNGNKIITTGGGGMLLFKDESLAKQAKHLTTQAKIAHPWELDHDATGYNYRMPNINAALGLAQLEQIDTFLSAKRTIAGKYKDFFSNTHFRYISEPKNARSNYWLNCILLNDKNERDNFLRFTNDKGITTRPAWRLMEELSMFRKCQSDDLSNSREVAERLVNLPSSPPEWAVKRTMND